MREAGCTNLKVISLGRDNDGYFLNFSFKCPGRLGSDSTGVCVP